MPHNSHVLDGINRDAVFTGKNDPIAVRDYYLKLADGWESPYEAPIVKIHDGVRVVRDDLLGDFGTKVRGGDCLISSLDKSKIDTIVYVQPRSGLAGVSILDVAKRHGFKVKLFMPSSKRISPHQAACIENGADAEFHRIAAMPNLNRIAMKWADARPNAFFVPLGLRHSMVTAGIVKEALRIQNHPEIAYVATSTGVLTRALQIAWPNTRFVSVAVSRNMKAGELGRAAVISDDLPFLRGEKKDNLPPFPTVGNYDAKVWKYIPKDGDVDNKLMWNVGKEVAPVSSTIYDEIDSYRDWDKKK
jgi:hypothetical protein